MQRCPDILNYVDRADVLIILAKKKLLENVCIEVSEEVLTIRLPASRVRACVLNGNDESSVVIHIPLIFISLTRSPQHFNPTQVWTCQPIRMKKVTKRYSRWRSAVKTGSAHSGLPLGNTGP